MRKKQQQTVLVRESLPRDIQTLDHNHVLAKHKRVYYLDLLKEMPPREI